MSRLLAAACLAGALCVPNPATAQTVVETTGEDIVVTGRGLEDAPGDRVISTVTLDRERIAESASGRLESVLGDVAGLQQFRRSDARSANPTSQGITLRGLGGNAASRALLILDGVPQADPFGGWVAFPAYATGRLGRVRVTRGGGGGYQGPGAIAGTIELDSATPGQLGILDAQALYGSRDAVDAQATATLTRGAGFATISGAYARGDGFVPTVADDRGPADRAAPYEQASGAVRGVIGIGGDTELQANLSAFADRRDRGVDFTDSKSEGADASLRLVGRGNWKWAALGYLQTRNFASSFASVNAARTTATQTLDQYNVPATGLGGRVEVQPPLGEAFGLRLGGDVRAVSGETQELYTFVAGNPTRRRVAGGATRTIGAFADGSAEWGALTATLGGRIDGWRIRDGRLFERPLAGGAALNDLSFPDRSGTEWTGRAGLAWRAADAVTLRAAGYRAWRLPTLNELYRPYRVGTDAIAANAALRPERVTGFEAGVDLSPLDRLRVSATWFDNALDGAIANVTAGQGPGSFPGVGFVGAGGTYRVRQNLERVRARGVELDAVYAIGPVEARASWAHTSARVRGEGAALALDGLRPAQVPTDQVSATLGYRTDAAALSATLRHVSSQFEDDQNARRLAAATTLDAFALVPVTAALAVEARAENVTDTRLEAGISGADVVERATPRTLWIGLRYRLR